MVAALALVLALYAAGTIAGTRQGGGSGGDLQHGLPQALGGVLVQPARSSDLTAGDPACRRGSALTVPAGGACAYRLGSGFLARRLRLRLTDAGPLTAVLVQPKPRVTDTHTLDAGHPTAELTYRQAGSTLTLTCAAKPGTPCLAGVTG